MIEVVLASQSPRRKQLLEWAEVPFEIIVKETDEKFPSEMQTDEVPVFIARNKALAVQALVRDERPVLAADTVVVLHNRIIGKPVDRDDAISILKDLSGQEHEVITGVVILYKGREIAFSDSTKVVFHPLSEEQIIFYVDKYRPYDKAGAYAIQEWIGVTGIKSVSGDFYNVMGLPVSRVIHALSTL
ncbi:MAG: septum formation protein Maf [Gemmatimonadaceae bacterium]|nr:septum formation protein Maf [Chitinophagaceae bacterium]